LALVVSGLAGLSSHVQGMTYRTLLGTLLFLAPLQAKADLAVTFKEAAPKDRFIVENRSQCDLRNFGLKIDLRGSEAGLLFDTTPGGAGLNVAQPFEVVEGAESVSAPITVADGDRVAQVQLRGLPMKSRIIFTVDVDDSLIDGLMGRTMVANSEIAGATVVLSMPEGVPVTAAFTEDGMATAPIGGCTPVSCTALGVVFLTQFQHGRGLDHIVDALQIEHLIPPRLGGAMGTKGREIRLYSWDQRPPETTRGKRNLEDETV